MLLHPCLRAQSSAAPSSRAPAPRLRCPSFTTSPFTSARMSLSRSACLLTCSQPTTPESFASATNTAFCVAGLSAAASGGARRMELDSQARSRVLPAAARPRSSRGEFSVLGLFHSLSLACACPSPQSRLHGRTFKFAERVRRNPPGGGRVLPANPCGCAGGFAVQSQIPFTDVPQGPVDGLSHEIAVIVRLSLDQRQHSPKLRVGRLLVPIRQVSHQCKPRPLDELWAAPAPGHRFPPCRSSEHEEMAWSRCGPEFIKRAGFALMAYRSE